MFLQILVNCSINEHHIDLDDNQDKTLINQSKFLYYPLKTQKNHTIENNIVNLLINKATINQKAIKINPV